MPNRRVCNSELEPLVALRREGLTASEIAERIGKPTRFIEWRIDLARKRGFDVTMPDWRKEELQTARAIASRQDLYSDDEIERIKQMCGEGRPAREIAEALGRTEFGVVAKAKKLGLPIYRGASKYDPYTHNRIPGLAEDRIGRCRVSVAADTEEAAKAFCKLFCESVEAFMAERVKGAA